METQKEKQQLIEVWKTFFGDDVVQVLSAIMQDKVDYTIISRLERAILLLQMLYNIMRMK